MVMKLVVECMMVMGERGGCARGVCLHVGCIVVICIGWEWLCVMGVVDSDSDGVW